MTINHSTVKWRHACRKQTRTNDHLFRRLTFFKSHSIGDHYIAVDKKEALQLLRSVTKLFRGTRRTRPPSDAYCHRPEAMLAKYFIATIE